MDVVHRQDLEALPSFCEARDRCCDAKSEGWIWTPEVFLVFFLGLKGFPPDAIFNICWFCEVFAFLGIVAAGLAAWRFERPARRNTRRRRSPKQRPKAQAKRTRMGRGIREGKVSKLHGWYFLLVCRQREIDHFLIVMVI